MIYNEAYQYVKDCIIDIEWNKRISGEYNPFIGYSEEEKFKMYIANGLFKTEIEDILNKNITDEEIKKELQNMVKQLWP